MGLIKKSERKFTSVDGDGVHSQRLDVVTISFNDSHPVLVDREDEGRVAGKTNDTETVSERSYQKLAFEQKLTRIGTVCFAAR